MQLVEAWDLLKPSNWKVIIAGPDEDGHQSQIESFIKKKGLTKEFEFMGPVEGEKKKDLYRSADLFILPTFSENFGIVIAEALALGLPVITTKAAPWEEIEKLKCGWWIENGTKSIQLALKDALSCSPKRLASMGQRGKIYAENTFDSIIVAKQMLNVYSWMLGNNNKPDYII